MLPVSATTEKLIVAGVLAGLGLLLVIVLAERGALLATLREIRDLPEREREEHHGPDV